MREMQQRSTLLDTNPPPPMSTETPVPSSIPPWVHLNTAGSLPDDAEAEQSNLLFSPPSPPRYPQSRILPNTRHHRPTPTLPGSQAPAHYKPGRKWDHLRTAEPPLLSEPIDSHQARWRAFMQAGPQAPSGTGVGGMEGRIVDAAWMEENMPDLHEEWTDPDADAEAELQGLGQKRGLVWRGKWLISPERQQRTTRLFWRLLLKNPFIPLAFRMSVFAFCAAALALAASLYVDVKAANADADPSNQCDGRASTYMAIIVDTIALPYIGYVTWDEYMSKPLGLRSVAAKTMLLLCDLYFVVFAASNLSLAFDALFDHRWACYDEQFKRIGEEQVGVSATCPDNPSICYQQKALAGVLFVGLVAWLMTFSISVLRVVEKLRPD